MLSESGYIPRRTASSVSLKICRKLVKIGQKMMKIVTNVTYMRNCNFLYLESNMFPSSDRETRFAKLSEPI